MSLLKIKNYFSIAFQCLQQINKYKLTVKLLTLHKLFNCRNQIIYVEILVLDNFRVFDSSQIRKNCEISIFKGVCFKRQVKFVKMSINSGNTHFLSELQLQSYFNQILNYKLNQILLRMSYYCRYYLISFLENPRAQIRNELNLRKTQNVCCINLMIMILQQIQNNRRNIDLFAKRLMVVCLQFMWIGQQLK
eukprot:TRINITY_DN6613_c0_g2_i2.p1 TRINITY_DN6613_c0_g2~~TRINITY_DN6613_c0_g2_i2.p1  ORF type:complete len:192 (-),score=-12.69 TRINITY_DN6613_c0_g2_i2:269-844(-)